MRRDGSEAGRPGWAARAAWRIVAPFLGAAIGATACGGTLEVSTSTLHPNFMLGDRVFLIDRSGDENPVRRGAPVVLDDPEEGSDIYLLRVIGLPGETIEIRENKVFIDDERFKDPYRHLKSFDGKLPPHARYAKSFGPVYVPKEGDKLRLKGSRILNERSGLKLRISTVKVPVREKPISVVKLLYGRLLPKGKREVWIEEDHYFVLGDNRLNSFDSRFFGFVKRSLITAELGTVYWSVDPATGMIRWRRFTGSPQ